MDGGESQRAVPKLPPAGPGRSGIPICGRRSLCNDPHGFTLIELLVVISILVLLTAILLPTLQRARNQARGVACQANLRQWGVAFAGYAADNDGKVPRLWWGGDAWGYLMRSYLHNDRELLLCPLAVRHEGDDPQFGHGSKYLAWYQPDYTVPVAPEFRTRVGSYGFNEWVCSWQEPHATEIMGVPPEELALYRALFAPCWQTCMERGMDRIPVVFDCGEAGNTPCDKDNPPAYDGDNSVESPGAIWQPWRQTLKWACIDRHGGAINALFLDWSMRKVGLKELWTFKWHKQFNASGPWTKAGGVQPEDWPRWMRRFKDY
jgi:prepilin-type N-terminal cleavage/methylation domain-containing protein/prepilin-type processing-associated H-X9-DG protein